MKGDYISKSETLRILQKQLFTTKRGSFEKAMEIIFDIHAVDATVVLRCVDCQYYRQMQNDFIPMHYGRCTFYGGDHGNIIKRESGFCDEGKRRF